MFFSAGRAMRTREKLAPEEGAAEATTAVSGSVSGTRYLYNKNIQGVLGNEGLCLAHSASVRVRIDSSAVVMPKAMHRRVCGRQ